MESAVESSKDQTSKSDDFVLKYFLKALYSACARAQFHKHKWLSCFPVQQSIGSLEKDNSHISLPPRFI